MATVACGGGDEGSSDAMLACAQWASAWCAREQACTPYAFTQAWGSSATCNERRGAACRARLAAPDTGLGVADIRSCATTVGEVGCDVFSVAQWLPACQAKPGQRALAAPCGDDSQCQSAYCRTDGKGSCGTCAVRGGLGKPCNDKADCEGDLACAATSAIKKCAARALAGESCDATRICIAPAVCQGGSCVAPAASGAACDPTLKNCDAGRGDYCHAVDAVCTPYAVVAEGAACGYFDGAFVACAHGSICQVESQGQGTCVATGDSGDSCSTAQPQPCRGGLVCQGGICGLPQPASCK